MNNEASILVYLLLSFVFANIPWMSDRFLLISSIHKIKSGLRWLEWALYLMLMAALGLALESRLMGGLSEQGWEFYVVFICLFAVFAIPGFIYCYDLKKILHQANKK